MPSVGSFRGGGPNRGALAGRLWVPTARIKGSVLNHGALAALKHGRHDMPKARAAFYAGNEKLAIIYQEMVASQLERSVRARGRAQRPGQRLASAIRHKDSRRWNVYGFTVGNFDRDPKVKLYARNLEVGTSVHVNRVVGFGFWETGAGRLVMPSGAGDAIGRPGPDAFVSARKAKGRDRPSYSAGPRAGRVVSGGHPITIKRPIKGYHYTQLATDAYHVKFLQGSPPAIMQVYAKEFARHAPGVDNLFFRELSHRDFQVAVVPARTRSS